MLIPCQSPLTLPLNIPFVCILSYQRYVCQDDETLTLKIYGVTHMSAKYAGTQTEKNLEAANAETADIL